MDPDTPPLIATPPPIKTSQNRSRGVVGTILVTAGSAVMCGAIAVGVHTRHFTEVAQHASGVVIEMRESRDSDGVTYAPTFRFQDAAGEHHTVSSSSYSSPPEFHVGEGVDVLYLRDDPQEARINTFWQVWGLAALLGIIAVVELPIGLVVLLWPRITRRDC